MEASEEMEAEGTQPWEMDLTREDPHLAAVDLEQNCLRVCQETEVGMEVLEEMEIGMEASEEIEAGMEALEEMEAEGTLPWEMDLIHEDPQPAALDLDQNCLRVCRDTKPVSLVVQDS